MPGKFLDKTTGKILSVDSWWEVDMFCEEFSFAIDQRSVSLKGQIGSDFVLQRLLYTFAASTSPRDREIFKHHGRVIVYGNNQALVSLPTLLLEYSAEAVAEIVRIIHSGAAVSGLDYDLKLWVSDAARVAMQGWKLAQPGLFKKDAFWEVRISVDAEESCVVQGTIVGLGLARRAVPV
jgi:hypothetical protein